MDMQHYSMTALYDAWVFLHAKDSKNTPQARIIQNAEFFLEQQGMHGVNPGEINRTSKGKPYFSDAPQVHLSVSHSGVYWVCAFSLSPLGIDIQIHRTCEEMAIARRFFHPSEAAYLKEEQTDFFQIWAAKESFVKYTGDGIDDAFCGFSVISGNGIDGDACGVDFTFVDIDPSYTTCICRTKSGRIHLIREQI